MNRSFATAILTVLALGTTVLPATAVPATAPAPITSTVLGPQSRADDAIAWFAARNGSTAYQGYCEKAVENAYGRTGVYASAIANWNDAVRRGAAHRGDLNPPKGALVFWNISAYGHVGVATGDSNFWATSVDSRIGKARLPYFSNYLGWAQPNF
ncbi:CHAP domain-containing protein [Kribbella sindirgiensis]|uniref:CHAP domain-containing protein n=1 Tax=Kribbella sindirgiensis TaxID=1124744 RepID=A0A4R0I7Y0_9ACTN|nr:CHAP domain-containing protein [Kribbella sindirgiensis]TCC17280.1 CHAP domain-containing protein [Kribbella sindirgiensis]